MVTTKFDVFPELPPELQEEIWQFAAHQEANSSARIQLIAPDPRGTSYPRLLPVLDSNLRYRPKDYYPEIQLRLVHRSHTLPGLFSACQASRNAIKPFYKVWEKETGGNVYVNEKRDVMYFQGSRFWLLRILHVAGRMNSEDDQVARLQHMSQLQDCHNLAFDMNTVPRSTAHGVQYWLRTFTGLKSMVVVVNAERKEVAAGTRFVLSSNERVREALVGSSWNFGWIDSITQAFLHRDIFEAGLQIPKLEFVLMSKSEVGDKWSKNLPVHSIR